MNFDCNSWGNIASIASFFLTVFISVSIFFFRRRILLFDIKETQVSALITHYNHLSGNNKFSVIARNTRVDLRNVLISIKSHYEKTWFSRNLNADALSDINKLIIELDQNEDCTRNSVRLNIKTIILKIENNPRLDYATK